MINWDTQKFAKGDKVEFNTSDGVLIADITEVRFDICGVHTNHDIHSFASKDKIIMIIQKKYKEKMMNGINIHGQKMPHDDVLIEGTRDELQRLADAINSALNDYSLDNYSLDNYCQKTIDAFDSGGEGYAISVNVLSPDKFCELESPYHVLLSGEK
jgi:hypothetical protein